MITPEGFIAVAVFGIAMASFRPRKNLAWAGGVSALVVIGLVILTPVAPESSKSDRISLKETAELQRALNQNVVASLESSHTAGEIKDFEYAWNLERRALAPAKEMLQELRSQPRKEVDQEWLAREIADWEFRCNGLQIVIDIYSSRGEIRAAKNTKDKGSSLDGFWNTRLPLLQANREKLLEFMHKPVHGGSAEELVAKSRDLLKGLDADLQVLTENAAQLEIRRTEAWLAQLKNEIVSKGARGPSAEAPPGLALEVDARLERLESVRGKMTQPPPRLQALEKHLERIQEAIPRTAVLNDIQRDVHQ